MSRIFLSHSSCDDLEAVALRDWLASEGWDDVFLDFDPDRGIVAGQRWEQRLHEAASRCEAVVFLVSGNWLASGWCMKEYTTARRLNKKLFAVLIDPAKTLADLPPELTDTWQVTDLTGGKDKVRLRAVRPGTQAEREVGFNRDGLTRLKRGLEKAGLDPRFFAWPPQDEPTRAPYRGLRPLEAEDAGIFFGRDAPIVEATDRMRGLGAGAPPRLMVILGASGAGKSSFLRAGLLPRLARDDAHFVVLPPVRPERAAITGENGLLRSLEVATKLGRSEIEAAYREGAAGLQTILADLARRTFRQTLAEEGSVAPPAIVLAIDQAEELFRVDGAGESDALLCLVRDLTASDAAVSLVVVFAIRSDSYDALEHAKALEGLRQDTMPLLPMPRGAFKEVIEGPPRRIVEAGGKLAIEPQLTDRLLEDLERGAGSDALPLLSFTLEQLYLGRRGEALKLADYEAAGGLGGAIDAAVRRSFVAADADPSIPRDRSIRERLLRRGLIPWLAGVDPETKSPRRNIARLRDIPDDALPLVNLLVDERLLSTDVQRVWDPEAGAEIEVGTVEPTHEALLRQWGLLQGWLAEDFGLLATLEGVQRASRDWAANGRDAAWLAHAGGRLTEARALDARPDLAIKLTTTDRAYLTACSDREETIRSEIEQRRLEREAERERRLADAEALTLASRRTTQRTRIGLVAAIILAVAAGGFGLLAKHQKTIANQKTVEANAQTIEATHQKNLATAQEKQAVAEKQRADANAEEATKSARMAQERLRSSQQNESASLAEQSLREDASGDTSNAIKLALKALPADLDKPDRPIVARAHYALQKAVWDHRLRVKAQAGTGQISTAVFSPDSRTVLASGRDGWVSLIDARDGTRIWHVDDKRHQAFQSVFSGDGREIATLYELPASIVVRNASDGAIVRDIVVPAGFAGLGKIALSPDGQRVYYTGGPTDARDVHVWAVATGREVATWPSGRDVRSFVKKFEAARDGGTLIMTSHAGIGVFDTASGAMLVSDQMFDGDVFDILAASEGPGLFVRGRTKLFTLNDGRQIATSWSYAGDTTHLNYVDVFSVSPDKKKVFLPTSETEFAAFDATDGIRGQVFKGHITPIVSAALSPDGRHIAASAKDNSIRVWAADSGLQERLFKIADAQFQTLSFSADSRSLMTYGGSTVYLWDVSASEVTALPNGLDRRWRVLKVDPAARAAVVDLAADRSSSQLAIIDLADGRIVTKLEHPGSHYWEDEAIAFSPSSKLVAVPQRTSASRHARTPVTDVSTDARPEGWQKGSAFVEIRDVVTGVLIRRLDSAEDVDEAITFSSDDKFVCLQTGETDHRSAEVSEIVELSSGRTVLSWEHAGDPARCTFAAHSVVLSSSQHDWTDVTAWDLSDGRELFPQRHILTGDSPSVQIVGNEQRLLIVSEQHPPLLLDMRSGASAAPLDATLIGVEDIQRLGSGLVALTRKDESWAVWDLARRAPLPALRNDGDLKLDLASHDGRRLLLSARAKETKVYQDIYRVVDVPTGKLLFTSAPTSFSSYPTRSRVFSGDGTTVALQMAERMIEVVSLTDPTTPKTLALQDQPSEIKLTDDGRWLVTFGGNGTVEVWDTTTGLRTYSRSDVAPTSLSILSGTYLSVRLQTGAAEVVDIARGATAWTSPSRDTSNFVASRDGQRLFALFPDRAVVYDLAGSRELAAFPCDGSKIFRATLSPDGAHVTIYASLGSGAKSALIDLASASKILEFEAEDNIFWAHAKPDLFLIESSSGIAVRRTADGGLLRTIKMPRSDSFVANPTGDAIALATKDNMIVTADLESGEVSTLRRLDMPPKSISFGPTKHELLVHDDAGTLSLWDVPTRRKLTSFAQRWNQHRKRGWLARTDPSGSMLAVRTPDRWVRVYSIATGAQVLFIPVKSTSVEIVDMALLDQTILAIATKNGGEARLEFLDVATRKTLPGSSLVGAFHRSSKIGLVPSNNRLIAVASDGTVSVLSRTFGTIDTFQGGGALEDAQAALSRDGRYLAVTGKKGEFRLWDTAAHEIVDEWVFPDNEHSTMKLTMSQDGERVVVGGHGEEHIVRLPLKYSEATEKGRRLAADSAQAEKEHKQAGPRLGVSMRPIEKGDAKVGSGSAGVFLIEVIPDSPAYLAGLRPGDIIVDVGNRNVDAPQDVADAVQKSHPGADLPISVMRDGRRLAFAPHF